MTGCPLNYWQVKGLNRGCLRCPVYIAEKILMTRRGPVPIAANL